MPHNHGRERKERKKGQLRRNAGGCFTTGIVCAADEAALVKAAKQLGFVFTTRTPQTVEIEVVSGSLSCCLSNRGCISVDCSGVVCFFVWGLLKELTLYYLS